MISRSAARNRSATTAIVVLTCWAVAGLVLIFVAGFRRGSRAPA